jgi:uncharacterized protein (DUF3820 family)
MLMPFGKEKGRRISQLNDNHLRWLSTQACSIVEWSRGARTA